MFRRSLILFIIITLVGVYYFYKRLSREEEAMISYQVDLRHSDLRMYWQDEQGKPFRSLGKLKNWLQTKGQKLTFAMNGGMFQKDNSPLGLFIQADKIRTPLNTKQATGNFYLKPNGVFYITAEKKATICRTEDFQFQANISYATQSGPLLMINGQIHPAFQPGSKNLNIRNGVGILPDNQVLFAMSREPINFYDFALYFKKSGCKNALFLDGFVSRTYLPEKGWIQTDGDFGVIIAVSEN